MEARRRISVQTQLRLFQERLQHPRWEVLPSRTREQVVVLLAQLLSGHQERLWEPARGEEVVNE